MNHPDINRQELLLMDPVQLRAMIRERVHHLLEVPLYCAILKGQTIREETIEKIHSYLEIWESKNLPTHSLDYQWIVDLLKIAENPGDLDIQKELLSGFKPCESIGSDLMRRVLMERRSIRNWSDNVVPEWVIDEILEAGLWAAHGCNLGSIRYLVVKEADYPGLFKGADVAPAPIHLIVSQDMRVYDASTAYQQNPELRERNRLLDCGAAMQNMLLMAHGLGLGAVWLTFNEKMVSKIIEYFSLESHYRLVAYIDIGFPLIKPLAPGRHAIQEVVIRR